MEYYELMKKYVPSVKTITEAYAGNKRFIQTVCRELNMQPTDFLLTLEEIPHYNEVVSGTNIPKISVMDFTNTTLEDELCKLNSQY